MGVDYNGDIVDTIFDVVSLGMSFAEVVANPHDVGAWIGLIGDVIDVVVPCVSGVGEIAKSINSARKVAEYVDNGIDTYRNLKKVDKKLISYKAETDNYPFGKCRRDN